MNARFAHTNFNVLDLDKSLAFYQEALGLREVRRIAKEDFTIVYLGDGVSDFQLELTHLKDRSEPYDLGDEEFHTAFRVDDFQGFHQRHQKMGCICYENSQMGIYFIKDPDGYWLEIVPIRD